MNEFSEDKLIEYLNDVHKATSDNRLIDASVRNSILERAKNACKNHQSVIF